MAQVKDKLASWYVQKFVISKSQVFDFPGFVQFKITGTTNSYSRQIILPENFFVETENELCLFGETGKKLLYSLGKKFGYRFATVGNLKSFDNLNSIEFKEYVYLVTRFVEGTYSSGITYELDIVNKKILFRLNDFVICSKSGKGYFLSAGGIAGIWAKLLGNINVEAVHSECQGRGAKNCVVEAAPKEVLTKFGSELIVETDLIDLGLSKEYFEINSPKKIINSSKSFQFFLDSKLFSYEKGMMKHNGQRYFIIESSILHLMEIIFSKNLQSNDAFAKVSFKTGSDFFSNRDNLSFLVDVFSAFGFGDMYVVKKGESFLVNVDYVPWTHFCKDLKHIFFANFISGALSKIKGTPINLKLTFSGFNGKGYTLTFS